MFFFYNLQLQEYGCHFSRAGILVTVIARQGRSDSSRNIVLYKQSSHELTSKALFYIKHSTNMLIYFTSGNYILKLTYMQTSVLYEWCKI